jgi:hypothetical protein
VDGLFEIGLAVEVEGHVAEINQLGGDVMRGLDPRIHLIS